MKPHSTNPSSTQSSSISKRLSLESTKTTILTNCTNANLRATSHEAEGHVKERAERCEARAGEEMADYYVLVHAVRTRGWGEGVNIIKVPLKRNNISTNPRHNPFPFQNSVPQGEVLSVLIFLIAINDITECVKFPLP